MPSQTGGKKKKKKLEKKKIIPRLKERISSSVPDKSSTQDKETK